MAKTRLNKRDAILESLFEFVTGNGTKTYKELLAKLSQGIDISRPEKEFMDRYETQQEYITGKKQRTELTSTEPLRVERVSFRLGIPPSPVNKALNQKSEFDGLDKPILEGLLIGL